jgi:hypothetical protein
MMNKQRNCSKPKIKHLSLKERIKGFKPQKCFEWDTGKPMGKEIL